MYMIKIARKLLLGLMLIPAVNYAADVSNEFVVISEITALNETKFSQLSSDINSASKSESRARITKYVTANLNSLIDNKFAEAKKQLIANLSASKALTAHSNEMKVQILSPDLDLITIQTYNAGYQTAGLFLIYDLKNIKLSLVPFEQDKRHEFENILDYKIIGSNLIQVTTKSRAAGDCGNIKTYQFSNGLFKLLKRRDFKCVG